MISTNSIKPFKLLSKETGLNPNSGRFFAERLGMDDAHSVDVVVIAKTDNPEQKTTITTFRDAKNKVIEMIHEYEGQKKPETHRLYSELPNYHRINLKGRLVQVFENLDITGRFKAWKKISSEKQYVKYNPEIGPTHLTTAKVSTAERDIRPTSEETHKLTEYYVPKAHGGISLKPKYIEFTTKKDYSKIPKITKINASDDVQIPKNDEYLAMRIYDSNDIKVPITQTALKEEHIGFLDIPVKDDFRASETNLGSFDSSRGVIYFNYKDTTKKSVIDTAYHESRHAFQYAIEALGGHKDTPYAKKCRKEIDIPKTPELQKLADIYHEADLNYVPAKVDYKAYRANPLESEAWEKGELGVNSYIEKGRPLSNQFTRIPTEEL